ncbi:MAG: glycosyltransferase family 4 protein [Parvularculaceae bacterium]
MRVVYYVCGWPPGRVQNGIVSAIGVLAPALRGLGCDVRILASFGESEGSADVSFLDGAAPARKEPAPVRVMRNWMRPGRHRFDLPALRIAEALGASPSEVFEIEESFGWSAIIARRTSAAVVTRLHGPWFMNGASLKGEENFDRTDNLRIQKEGAAIAGAEAVTAPSKYVLDAVRNRYGIALANGVVIPNAVEAPDEASAWRADRADPDEILFVGRFDRHKGADTVLRAFAIAAAGRPGLKLTFVGPADGAIQDGGKEKTREAFLSEHMAPDIAARVAFTGPLPHAAIGPLRRRAFITLIGSLDENFPSTLLEAMAMGSPVVSTAVGGIPEIARDGEHALLTLRADPAAMAGAIGTLLSERALAEKLGGHARRRALDAYAPVRVARTSADYYADLIARRARKAG